MKKYLFLFICAIVIFSSCNEEMVKSNAAKPSAMGVMNEIVVVSEEDDWNTMIGDTFQYYFASAYPIMPQPEPFFDLRHFTLEELEGEPLRRQLRTYVVLANLNDDDAATTRMVRRDLGEDRFVKARKDGELKSSVGRDKWARNQIVIYLFGRNEDELVQNIKNSFSAVAKRINIHDEQQLKAKLYAENVNLGISKELEESYGVKVDMPGDFNFVLSRDNFSWYRKDTKDATLSFAIKKIPYQSDKDFSKENLIELANHFGHFLDKDDPENYMRINETDLPIFDYTREINGNYTKEIRGIWEMTKDFEGGPFAAYMMHNKDDGTLVYVYSFVFAPGKTKRDYFQQMDYLVKQMSLI